MNLKEYIPKDKTWLDSMAEEIGWEHLGEYYNRVFLLLYEMRRGTYFSIVDKVAPDNYRLFMGCLIIVMTELASYGIHDFTLEAEATIIHRI